MKLWQQWATAWGRRSAFFSAEVVPAQSPVQTQWSPRTVISSSSRGIGYIGLVCDPLVGTELGEPLLVSILHWCGFKWLRCAGQRERVRESENGGDLATHWMANSCFLKTATCPCHNTNLHCSFRFACKSPLGHAPNHLIPTWQYIKFEVMCSEVYTGWNSEQHYRPTSDIVHLCLSGSACHPIPSRNSLCIPRKNRHFFYHFFKNLGWRSLLWKW